MSALPTMPAKVPGFLIGSPARAAVVVCLLVSPVAFSQNAVTQMVWTGPGPRVVTGVIVFFAVAAVCIILLYAATSRKRVRSEEELSTKLFGEGCQRCRLTREEANVLFGITAFVPDHLVKGHLIFDSLPLYERCLDAYALRTLHHQAHHAERIAEQDEVLASLRRKLGFGVLGADQHLASTRNIGVGQKVTLVVPAPAGQRARSVGAMVSHVGEFWFTVRIVEDFGGIINLFGSEMTVAFLRQGDAPYSVAARVRDQGSSGEINFYHTIKLSRNQNRQYLRLDINLPIKYRVIERIDAEERAFSETYSAHTVDISGGGVCFCSEVPLQAGDVILLTMNIPGATLTGIRSKILKVITVEGKGSTIYRHLVQFVLIEQQQREKIVKFIFEKQRALLQMR